MMQAQKFLQRHLPHLCLLVFGLVTTIGAFDGGLWAALGIGFSLLAFMSAWLIERNIPQPHKNPLLLLLVFFAAAALLNLHSWLPQISWLKWEELITIFLPLSVLTAPAVRKYACSGRLFTVLPWFAAISACALSLELAMQAPLLKFFHPHGKGHEIALTHYNRGFSYLVILAFPLMASLWNSKKRWLTVPFILILFIPAGLTESRAAKLALVLGLITVCAAYFLPQLTRRLMMAVPLAAIGWPFAAQKLFLTHRDWIEHWPRSWEDRVEIWDYMSYRILDKPWLGWGLGTSPKVPFARPHGALYQCELFGAPHPHNAIIQLWVELGIPGLILGIAFAVLLLRKAGRLKPALQPFALGAWVAAFCLSMIAYDFWSDSLWAAFALTGFAFALLGEKGAQESG